MDLGFKVTTIEEIGLAKNQFEFLIQEISSCKVRDQWREIPGEYNVSEVPVQISAGEVILHTSLQEKVRNIGEALCKSNIVVGYFGGTPQLVDYSSWWSLGGRHERGPQLWHRDIDNIFFLKIFIYLSNVTEADGPHFYIPRSHRFNQSLTFKRYNDDQISKITGLSKPIAIVGNKGSVIIEDTFGFHKGSSPAEKKTRLILQYQFACLRNP
jgi:hypothetical protein